MTIAVQQSGPQSGKPLRMGFPGLARVAAYLQAIPLTVILAAFLLLPILMILVVSFWDYDFASMHPDFLLTNYIDTLGSWVTWKTYLNTLRFAVIVWGLTLFIGFWVAYYLAFHIRTAAMQMVLADIFGYLIFGAIQHEMALGNAIGIAALHGSG